RFPIARKAPYPGQIRWRPERSVRQQNVEARRQDAADVEFRTSRHLEIDQDDGSLRYLGAFAGDERNAVPRSGEAPGQIPHHSLRSAVRRGREPVPEKKGDVHLAYQSTLGSASSLHR